MKKLTLGLFLALVALGFLTSPALAADSPGAEPTLSAADRAFIASIAGPREPMPPGRMPRRPPSGGTKALCSATANCASGTVYCEDNTNPANCTGVDRNCSVGEPGHVTCDGATTWCPTACPCTCEQLESWCAQECYPCDYNFTCTDPDNCDYFCHCRFSTCPP